MTFKKLLIIMTFAMTLVIIMLLGTSYAWYQFDNAYTSFTNVQTFDDDINLAVIFTNTNTINTNVGIPLTPEEVDEYSEKTLFTLTASSEALAGKNISYQITLDNIKIDTALTSATSLRYSLLETVNGVTTTVKEGHFYAFNSTSLELKPMTKLQNLDTTYAYEFRMWLEETGTDQNALMGKRFSGKIKVSTAVK